MGYCGYLFVCVHLVHTLTHVCAQKAAGSYPNGPCTDLIWSGGEEVFQLQDCVACLDDLAQNAGGEKCNLESRGLNCFSILYCH